MGWRHYTLQTLKALAILAVGAIVVGVWIMSVVLACASGRGKGMH